MRYRILRFKTLSSTNDVALKLARDGAKEGTAIIAEYQTHGRGRGRKRWYSSRGKNLLFSVLVRPPLKASEAPWLTRIASEAVADSLSRLYGLPARIKRPNDVLVRDRKIAGILVESCTKAGNLDYAVIGVGVNVLGRDSVRTPCATSIYLENVRNPSIIGVFHSILTALSSKYEKIIKMSHK